MDELELNIQMFAEEADNDSDEVITADTDTNLDDVTADENNDESDVTVNASGESDKKSPTKLYSERLNKERDKIRNELRSEVEKENKAKLDAIAKSRNFESWDELEEYDEAEKITQLGISDSNEFKSLLDTLISKNPIVKEAQDILLKQKKAENEKFLKNEVLAISKVDSSIKTFDDLVNLDKYDELLNKVNAGYSLSDAYKLLYFDKIKSVDINAAKQEVLTGLDSKSHLKTASGNAGKEIHVPEDILAMYKKNIPGMSDADIRAHYAKSIGGIE